MYKGKKQNISIMKWIRRGVLTSLLLFSITYLYIGLTYPFIEGFFYLIFGGLAGFWFLKEFSETSKFGIYNTSSWKDLQWLIISLLFLLPGTYLLAIIAILIAYLRPKYYMKAYREIIHN